MLPGEGPDLFRRIAESSASGVLIVRAGIIEYANPAALHILGASPAGVVLHRPLAVYFRAEDRVVRADGAVIDVEAETVSIDDESGPATCVSFRDVTERRRRESQLRDSEERLRLAFAGAKEGVWDWNFVTGEVVYSPRWKQMLGYEDDEIEPHVRAWERLLHPDDKPRAEALSAAVLAGSQGYESELRLRHKEGHYITVLTRGLPIRDPDGQVVRIVGTHLDITERKRTELALRESEERLALAFAGAQEGIWDWNLETDACLYSPRWKQMLGYADHEIEPHISAWERLVHPDDRVAADRAHDSVAKGQPTYEAEFRLRHKEGHYIDVLSRGFPVRRDPGGPVIRIVGTHFDLTERRKREAERARNELLAHLVFVQEDERRRIARDMHDQFGEYLTALSLRIGLLREASHREPLLGPHLTALEEIAQRLDNEVDALVWQLRPTALDDLGLRAALGNYVQEWSERSGIAAELHTTGLLESRLSPEVETALYRIAQEALNNAAKHSHAHRVEVLLERRADCVLLVVEDDGVGFDHVEKAEQRRVARTGGFGIVGMRERAALVGAHLQVDSSPGGGTSVLVRMAVGTAAPQAVDLA